MPTIEEFLKKQHEERAKREERTMRELLREYGRLDKALGRVYAEFEGALDAERERRGDAGKGRVPVAWLHKDKRLKGLLDAVKSEIGKFGARAAAIVERGQKDEIDGQAAGAVNICKLLGIKSPGIPRGGPKNGPGKMGDGRKIADHFSKKLSKLVTGRTRQAAVNSVTAESGAASKKLKAAHGIILGRSLTTARTETMRAGRDTALGIYRENRFPGWTWHSQLGPMTCDFCREMHGTRHVFDEPFESHPNCRCIAVPEFDDIAEAARIEKRYAEIEREGHAVQRHGEGVTEQQLDDRALRGIDPASGTLHDAYKKNPDGTPKIHKYGGDATKFRTRADLVRAEEYLRSLQEFADKLQHAEDNDGSEIRMDNVKLEDVFGALYRNNVFGKTRLGTKNAPTGSRETDFTDGTLFAFFEKNPSGQWRLTTMFPKPKN